MQRGAAVVVLALSSRAGLQQRLRAAGAGVRGLGGWEVQTVGLGTLRGGHNNMGWLPGPQHYVARARGPPSQLSMPACETPPPLTALHALPLLTCTASSDPLSTARCRGAWPWEVGMSGSAP